MILSHKCRHPLINTHISFTLALWIWCGFLGACLPLSTNTADDEEMTDASATTDSSSNVMSSYAPGELVWACPADGTIETQLAQDLRNVSITDSGGTKLSTGQGSYVRILGNDAADYDAIATEAEFFLTEVFVLELSDGRIAVIEMQNSPENWYFNSDNQEWIQTKIYFYEGSLTEILAAVDDTIADYTALHAAGFNLGNKSLLDDLEARDDLKKVAMIVPKLTPVGGNTQITRIEVSLYDFSTTIGADEITLYVDDDFTDYAGGFAKYSGMTVSWRAEYAESSIAVDFPEYEMTVNAAADGFEILDAEDKIVNSYDNYDSFEPLSVFYQYCGYASETANPLVMEL